MKAAIIFNMPDADYRKAEGLSQSALKIFMESPMLYRERMKNPLPPTKAMKFGTLFDMYLLERERFDKIAVNNEGRERRKDVDKEWYAKHEAAGRLTYSPDEFETLKAMSKSVWAHQEAVKLMAKSRYQVSVFAPYTFADGFQLQLKSRFDILPTFFDAIADVKKTVDASLDGFGRQMINYGHHIQAAFELMIYNLVNGADDQRKNFAFIAVQEDAFVDDRGQTYGVQVQFPRRERDPLKPTEPSPLEIADAQIAGALLRYRQCLETDVWPGDEQTLNWVSVPHWLLRKEAA